MSLSEIPAAPDKTPLSAAQREREEGRPSGNGDAQTIRVAGKTWAVGLFWQIAGEGNIKEGARRWAKHFSAADPETAYDFVVTRDTTIRQFALGSLAAGHRKGINAAAAAVAERLNGSWIAVFPLVEGHWYVAARNDAILPDGDRLYRDAQELEDRLASDLEKAGWQRLYLPREIALGRRDLPAAPEDPPDLAPILEASPPFPLKPASAKNLLKLFFAAATVILTAALVMHVYDKIEANKNAARLALRREKTLILERRRNRPPPPPWQAAPPAALWLAACERALERLQPPIPGWVEKTAECRGANAATTYERAFGTLGLALRFGPRAAASFTDDAKTITFTAPLGVRPAGRAAPVPRIAEAALRNRLLATLQPYAREIDIATFALTASPARRNAPGPHGRKTGPLYPAADIKTFTTMIPPERLAAFLPRAGDVFAEARYHPKSGLWEYRATIFAKPPSAALPPPIAEGRFPLGRAER